MPEKYPKVPYRLSFIHVAMRCLSIGDEMSEVSMCGVVKKVCNPEGFGFISVKDIGDVFFHKSQCSVFASLVSGVIVSFDLIKTFKGIATQVAQESNYGLSLLKQAVTGY